jgi:hypothetical protein
MIKEGHKDTEQLEKDESDSGTIQAYLPGGTEHQAPI